MTKKIGIVTNGVHNNEFGGTHIYFSQLAKRWKDEGNDVYLFSYDSAFQVLPDPERFISVGRTLSAPSQLLPLYRTLMGLSEQLVQMDVIHSDFWTAMPALCRITRQNGIPYIHECRGSLFNVDKIRNVYKWLILKLFNPDTMLFVDRKSLGQYQQTYNRSNGVYVPVPIDLELFQPISAERKSDNFTILYASWLRQSKGLLDLLEAVKLIWQQYPNTGLDLVIAGEGPLRSEVEALAESNEPVTYLGNIPNNKMPEVFAKADLLVYPSYFEGFPRTILEAYACGLPTVATEVGGLALLREKEIGVVVPPGDVSSLVKAIVGMMEDSSMRKNFSEKGQLFVRQEHAWSYVLGQISQLC